MSTPTLTAEMLDEIERRYSSGSPRFWITDLRPIFAAARRDIEEWRPIASAPKDGRKILAYSVDAMEPTIYLCHWSKEYQCWWHSTPTHWLPLPTPPEPDGQPRPCDAIAEVREIAQPQLIWETPPASDTEMVEPTERESIAASRSYEQDMAWRKDGLGGRDGVLARLDGYKQLLLDKCSDDVTWEVVHQVFRIASEAINERPTLYTTGITGSTVRDGLRSDRLVDEEPGLEEMASRPAQEPLDVAGLVGRASRAADNIDSIQPYADAQRSNLYRELADALARLQDRLGECSLTMQGQNDTIGRLQADNKAARLALTTANHVHMRCEERLRAENDMLNGHRVWGAYSRLLVALEVIERDTNDEWAADRARAALKGIEAK